MNHGPLYTERLEMVPMTIGLVEAMMLNRRAAAEEILGASLPEAWPGRALIERAFAASLEAILDNPGVRLWGDRVLIGREGPRRVIGSVVFHGAPSGDGAVEIAYGVEEESQRRGYASEAVLASIDWALDQPNVHAIRAVTPSWHIASRRVLEKCGLSIVDTRDSDMLGELFEYERRK